MVCLGLLKAGTPSMRRLADYLMLPYSKQAKTNRIWRLFNKAKTFKPIVVWKESDFLLQATLSKRYT